MKYYAAIILFVLTVCNANAQLSPSDKLETNKGSLTIQPVQHASLVLSIQGLTIYVDPTGGTKNYTGIAAPDIILITDIHGDHFNLRTIDSVKTENTVLVVPQAVADMLPGADKTHLVILKNGDNIEHSGISIKAIPMYNLPESSTARHTKGRGNGYILTIGGKNVYISGDTQGIPEMRSLKNIDVAFVCMNLPFTMDIKEAADAVLEFKPKIIYPYHYRGQDTNAFKNLVDEGHKDIEVRLRNWYPG